MRDDCKISREWSFTADVAGKPAKREIVLEGIMPSKADGSPRFPTRMDGYEAGIVAGTLKPRTLG